MNFLFIIAVILKITEILGTTKNSNAVILVDTQYDVELGYFLLLEVRESIVTFNEYPAFYSENPLLLCKWKEILCVYYQNLFLLLFQTKITCINQQNANVNYQCGYIIGSHENFYPITPLKSPMHCGRCSLSQFGNRTVTFRDFYWDNGEIFTKANATTNVPIINAYKRSKEICYVCL